MSYSEPLIQEITAIFKSDYGAELTRDEALEYLDSLADLYLAVAGIQHSTSPASTSIFLANPSLEHGGLGEKMRPSVVLESIPRGARNTRTLSKKYLMAGSQRRNNYDSSIFADYLPVILVDVF